LSKKIEKNLKVLLLHSSWALTLTSGLSYFLGFVRDRILAQTYGLSQTLDIYNASFVIPDMLLSIVIGTTMSAAFLPIFTKQYDAKKSLGYKYAQQIMSWGLLIVIAITIVIGITLPYFAHHMVEFEGMAKQEYIKLTRILLISPILFVFSNTYGRMLLSFKEFLWYGISPAFYNLGIVIGAIFFAPTLGNQGLIFGVLIGAFLHLSIRLINVKRKKYNFKHKLDFSFSPEIRKTISLTAPKIMQYGMWAFMLAAFTKIASGLEDGSITVYNYARNFQSIPVSLPSH
jgi:putative peptidoglycan lipid II flippase